MTVLSICQDALNEIGEFEVPSTLVGSSNATAKQVLALAQREGQLLSKRHDWQVLQDEYTFTTTSGTATYSLPTAYRHFVSGTWWDRANYWELFGPATAREWQTLKSGIVTDGVRRWFRLKGNEIVLHPTPTVTGDTIVFEYISKNWCESSGGTGQSAWAADTDVGVLDEELMTMGVKWRFLKEKGLPYEEDFNEYETEVENAIARDKTARTVSFDRTPDMVVGVNIPESGYGS
jgi:hypothetical protein